MKPVFETRHPEHLLGALPDAVWKVLSNYTFNSFYRTTAGSMTDSTANTNLIHGGKPAPTEKTSPWIRARQMDNTNNNAASENEEEIDIEESILQREKAKSAALRKLNKTRLALKKASDDLARLDIEDDYVEGLRFILKQHLENGLLLSVIASMFPDAAKRNAARATLVSNNEIEETTSNKIKTLRYIAQPA